MTDNKSSRIVVRDVGFEPAVVEPPAKYADDEIGPGKIVTLHFALMLEDSSENTAEDNSEENSEENAKGNALIDSNFAKEPVRFTIGDGNLLPGFEHVLLGLKAGAADEVVLAPGDAFGLANDDNIQRFARYQFPPDLALAAGLVINFADSTGNNQAGVVKEFDSALVEVDFNHPLAGRNIRFKFHIHDVQLLQASTD